MLRDSLLCSMLAGILILGCSSIAAAEQRTWTDSTGKHRVEAEFVKMANGQVTLLRADGREVKLPLAKLSKEDQKYIERLRRTRRTSDTLARDKPEKDPPKKIEPDVTQRDVAADEVADSNRDNQFKVPDGNPRKLLAFITQMQVMKPAAGGDAESNASFHRDVQFAIVEAADKLLDRRARKPEVAMAVGAKLNALTLLSRMSRDPEVEQVVKAFPTQLHELKQPVLAKSAQTLLHDYELATANTNSEVQAAVQAVSQHLSDFGNLTTAEVALARAAGRASQKVTAEFAAETHRALAETLMQTPTARKAAETMLGKARRFGLVGNEMHLVGLTPDNQSFDLKQYQGKVVLVDFWATWCKPCMEEMPNIRRNYEKYHERGFEVVAVSVDRDLQSLQQYLMNDAPPWTVLVDQHPQNKTPMSAHYAITGIPSTFLIGADGKVLMLNCRGARLGKELERLLGG